MFCQEPLLNPAPSPAPSVGLGVGIRQRTPAACSLPVARGQATGGTVAVAGPVGPWAPGRALRLPVWGWLGRGAGRQSVSVQQSTGGRIIIMVTTLMSLRRDGGEAGRGLGPWRFFPLS